MPTNCRHLDRIRPVTVSSEGCEECLRIGASWVHLRVCLTCGQVGCCDSSEHRHASRHAAEQGHPIVQTIEPDEDWGWCFVDEEAIPAETIASVMGIELPVADGRSG
jgi:uncharacterized UBP type Zn finger protein